jgi:hypothetical protein
MVLRRMAHTAVINPSVLTYDVSLYPISTIKSPISPRATIAEPRRSPASDAEPYPPFFSAALGESFVPSELLLFVWGLPVGKLSPGVEVLREPENSNMGTHTPTINCVVY